MNYRLIRLSSGEEFKLEEVSKLGKAEVTVYRL